MIDIKCCTVKMLKDDFQIEPEITELLFEKKVLDPHDCRNALIRKEYSEKIQPKEAERLKMKLADKYCVSFDLIQKIVSNRL